MGDQITTSAEALRLFFTEDIYLVSNDEQVSQLPQNEVGVVAVPAIKSVAPAEDKTITVPAIELPVSKETVVPEIVKTAPAAIKAEQPVTQDPAPVVFKYLGKNQKNVLILVNDLQNEVSTERGRELLRNLVKAIQLTANDFALLNYASCAETQFGALEKFFSSKLVMAFGVTPSQLGLADLSKNSLHIQGGIQLVFSGNLDELAEDQQGKKTLWGSLKQLSI